jgi:membrane associated rhomboid family serine protease
MDLMKAPVSLTILALTVVVSLYTLYADRNLLESLILRPFRFFQHHQYHTIVTSGFVHADLTHLFFNGFSFFFFGPALEPVIGHWQFGALYIISMIVADIPTLIKYRRVPEYGSLGASGAVSAIIFSFILYSPFSTIYLYFLPVPAILYGVLFLIYCVVAARYQNTNINHSAHFYGALSGVVLTLILDPRSIHFFLRGLNRF